MGLKKETIRPILFFGFAIVISLAVGELALRLISERILIYNIEMLKYANTLKMRDPLNEISHVHIPNKSADLMGVNIELNSLGNRSKELSEVKQLGEKRVYVMGTSMTMGWGVPADQVFTYITEQNLRADLKKNINFINAGVGNYDSFSAITVLYRNFDKVKPDAVVLHYFIADADIRPVGQKNSIIEKSYLGAFFYNYVQSVMFKKKYNSLFEFYQKIYTEDDNDWKKTKSTIVKLRDFLKEKNIPLIVMIIPDFHDLSQNTPYLSIYDKVQTTFEQMGLNTVNSVPEFISKYAGQESKLWVAANDPHPNAEAHYLMAQLLTQYFLANKLFDGD